MKEWLCLVQARSRRVAGLPLPRGGTGSRIHQWILVAGPLVLTLLTEQNPKSVNHGDPGPCQELARGWSAAAEPSGEEVGPVYQPERLALGHRHLVSLHQHCAQGPHWSASMTFTPRAVHYRLQDLSGLSDPHSKC